MQGERVNRILDKMFGSMQMNPDSELHAGVILVTAPSRAAAEAIAHALIQEKLAACVSLMPICSVYTWQNEVHTEEEWQLFIKSTLAQFSKLEARVRELHSYEVPEIIALPIVKGSSDYLQWINDQVHGPSS